MSTAAETATEVVADVVEEVADQTQHIADAVRGLTQVKITYAGLGLVVGATVSGVVAYRVAYSRASLKCNEIAEEEIAQWREHYQDKVLALEEKPALEELVAERGYTSTSVSPPMAVSPSSQVVSAVERIVEEPTPAPKDPTVIVNANNDTVQSIFGNAEAEDLWDWHKERSGRSPIRPYVIHVDEREEGYDEVTVTYYEADDVVCNERDEIIDAKDREKLFGERNLEKFGHGSNDRNVVYIRNDQLETQYEVIKSPNSYAVEVHGFDGEDTEIQHSYRRRERPRFDDESPSG